MFFSIYWKSQSILHPQESEQFPFFFFHWHTFDLDDGIIDPFINCPCQIFSLYTFEVFIDNFHHFLHWTICWDRGCKAIIFPHLQLVPIVQKNGKWVHFFVRLTVLRTHRKQMFHNFCYFLPKKLGHFLDCFLHDRIIRWFFNDYGSQSVHFVLKPFFSHFF